MNRAAAVLDRRLERAAAAPLIVALSGGGDSLSLLLSTKAWADAAGRRLVAVTVDHGLQPAAADWASWCRARAGRLGVEHLTLVWEGAKPVRGLPAAARAARHRLIARAARAAGAGVILMGHTADDLAEASVMRAAGVRISDPAEWSPSPVWPEGRDLFVLRPLLAARRAELRAALVAAGETWIEDPANADPASPRARARQALVAIRGLPCAPSTSSGSPSPARGQGRIEKGAPSILHPPMRSGGGGAAPACAVTEGAQGDRPCDREFVAAGPGGDLMLDRHALTAMAPARARAFLAAAVVCASGTERPPRGARLDRLSERVAAGERFVSALAGARVEADGDRICILREAGDMRRAGGVDLALLPGEPVVWDGRFEMRALQAGLAVRPLEGHVRELSRAERTLLRRLAPAPRRVLPAIVDRQGRVGCPTLAPDPRLAIRPLVMPRLAGALGVIRSEAAASAWRKGPGHPRLDICERDEADR